MRRPHRPVKPATVGHWLKRIMTLSGIDTGIFSPHSTRGAATSKARAAGVSVPDILRAADWSSVSTFKRFYHRPVHSSEFGRVVLGSMQPIATQKLVSYKRYHVVNYVVGRYPEPPEYNYRFLKECCNPMRRMNCMRRWRIPGDNIVSSHPYLPSHLLHFIGDPG